MRIVVLGMHKSGTTLVAQLLHAAGIDMGDVDRNAHYDDGGHYERPETKALNRLLLGCGDAHSLEVLGAAGTDDLSPARRQQMATLVRELDARHPSWGFKDPRTCLTIDAWNAVLPSYRIVGIYRHPLEVWHHYAHSKRLRRRASRGFAALTAWHLYNRRLLELCRGDGPELLLLDYGQLMDDRAPLDELARFVGLAPAKLQDLRAQALQRSSRAPSSLYRVSRWLQARVFGRDVEGLYEALEAQRRQLVAAKRTTSCSSQR